MTDTELLLWARGRTDGSDYRCAAAEDRGLVELLFSTQGRIGRSDYWRGFVTLTVIAIAATLATWALFGPVTMASRFAQLVITLCLFYSAYCVMAKRFQDHDQPAAWALMGLGIGGLKAALDLAGVTGDPWQSIGLDALFWIVQVGIGLWYFIVLGCLRGTDGKNQYGRSPV